MFGMSEACLFCGALPFGVVALLWAWARFPSFGAALGTLSLAALACGVPIATVVAARDVARTDRLHGRAMRDACTLEMPASFLPLPDAIDERAIDMSPELAAGAGLPTRDEARWPATLRRSPRWTGDADTLLSYATSAPSTGDVFVASEGEIGPQRVALAAQARDPVAGLLVAPPEVHADAIIAHETFDVTWFWIVDSMLVLYDADADTLELRTLDLDPIARATGVGTLGDPYDGLVADPQGGLFVGIPDTRLAIGRLGTDGAWTRTPIATDAHAITRLSLARSGGLCVFDDAGDAIHVTGAPLAAEPWPVARVLEDRQVALIALAIAWIVALWIGRRAMTLVRPWWALRRGRARDGTVRDALAADATWIESGQPERALRSREWLGFPAASSEREPAVAIDVVVDAPSSAYRVSARGVLEARCLSRGTRAEAAALLGARLRASVSWLGFIALLTGIPAVIVAIAS